MQKSLQGLLQALLYDIYRKHPALVRLASPERWDSAQSTAALWGRRELSDTLIFIARMQHSPVKICLFIDGLDEFSGDHLDLCSLLESFSKSDHVKLCVSSRPWNIFDTAFGSDSLKILIIHEHTTKDIRRFAISEPHGSGTRKLDAF